MNNVIFSCTSLEGVNKVGTLKKDEDGYRTMVVGALNVFNSGGQFYAHDEAVNLFNESGAFMRRVNRAALRAEVGHPKPPPMSADPAQRKIQEQEFARRCMTIDDNNVCAQHRRVWLDYNAVKDGRGKPVIAIMSSVIPSGEKFEFLERQLSNPHENVCFSIRAFTNNTMWQGIEKRVLREIITFDNVNEPGISVAEKYFSPALESHDFTHAFSRGLLEEALYTARPAGMSMESAFIKPDDLFKSLGWEAPGAPSVKKPVYSRW